MPEGRRPAVIAGLEALGYSLRAMGTRGEIFSSKANTAKRTYFFNVKENRTGDIYLNIVESKKAVEESSHFERQSLIVFKEDLEPFLDAFDQAVRFIRKK
jgi:hypothetical protein